ncbi:MAG TPA: host attachment protein [Burkholderiales bacterium]|nr:host attachment protein [Burkholderiales bacterium]
MNTWIIAADSARARILQFADRDHRLVEIDDLPNPEEQLGDYLEQARTEQRYDRLYLVAPPTVLGRLRKQLGKEVEKLVCEELDRDLFRANARELERYFASRPAR